jgi:hypothetical protein
MVLAGVILLGEHRPAWYQPMTLNGMELERVRNRAAAEIDRFSSLMVRADPFPWAISDKEANEWVAALLHDRPDLAASVPRQISAPAFRFEEGLIRLGAKFDSGTWRAVIGARLVAGVSPEGRELEIRLERLSIGSLPIPAGWAGSWLARRWHAPSSFVAATTDPFRPRNADGPLLRQETDGRVRFCVRNRFVWPNGERPFRITAITACDGQLHLTIEPLP